MNISPHVASDLDDYILQTIDEIDAFHSVTRNGCTLNGSPFFFNLALVCWEPSSLQTSRRTQIYDLSLMMLEKKVASSLYRPRKYLTPFVMFQLYNSQIRYRLELRQSSKSPTLCCMRWHIFHPAIPYPDTKLYQPLVTLWLFSWQMFSRAPFFSATSSDLYSQDLS